MQVALQAQHTVNTSFYLASTAKRGQVMSGYVRFHFEGRRMPRSLAGAVLELRLPLVA